MPEQIAKLSVNLVAWLVPGPGVQTAYNTITLNAMFRFSISFLALLMACSLLLMPQRSVALDLFGTEQSVQSDKFAFTQDAASCDRERISKPLTLADVVDLALCNNPQTHSLWLSARIQAANVGTSMAA